MPSLLNAFRGVAAAAVIAGCASAPQTAATPAPAPAASTQSPPPPQPTPNARAVARPPASPAALTTLAGVYTMDQAKRGAEVYAGACQSCHSPASHTGNSFKAGWVGRPLSELYNYLSSEMPQNDPGSLDAQQVADVTAYILRLNSMPTGERELPANADSLTNIQISPAPSSAVKPPHHH